MTIVGKYHHIHHLSANPRVTAEWYVGNLGAHIENEAHVRGSIRFRIHLGDALLNVSGLREGERLAVRGEGKVYGIDHIALLANGIEDLVAKLQKNEVKIVRSMFTTDEGGRGIVIEAPDGVLIEIMELI